MNRWGRSDPRLKGECQLFRLIIIIPPLPPSIYSGLCTPVRHFIDKGLDRRIRLERSLPEGCVACVPHEQQLVVRKVAFQQCVRLLPLYLPIVFSYDRQHRHRGRMVQEFGRVLLPRGQQQRSSLRVLLPDRPGERSVLRVRHRLSVGRVEAAVEDDLEAGGDTDGLALQERTEGFKCARMADFGMLVTEKRTRCQ